MRNRGFEIIAAYKKENITLPARKTANSAGYDIAAADDTVLMPNQVTLISTGLKAYMRKDEYLGIHIRSSMAIKNKLLLINSQGIIDADYYNNQHNEGHIMIAVINLGTEKVLIHKGTRVAQGIFYKYLKTDDDVNTKTLRTGGMGSTGK